MTQELPPSASQAALDLLTKDWAGFFSGPGHALLCEALPDWLQQQRWFGGKGRSIAQTAVAQWAEIGGSLLGIVPTDALPAASTLRDALLLLDLTYRDGSADRYLLPLAFASSAGAATVEREFPRSILLALPTPTGRALLHDACVRDSFRYEMLRLITSAGTLHVHTLAGAAHEVAKTIVAAHESRSVHALDHSDESSVATVEHHIAALHRIEPAEAAPEFAGHMPGEAAPATLQTFALKESSPTAGPSTITGTRGALLADPPHTLPSRVGSAEQSNTNFLYGTNLLMKLFRRLQPGENPDVEIGRFLTEQARFNSIAPLLGEISFHAGEITTLAMLQPLVPNQGDGWQWTQQRLIAYFANVSDDVEPTPSTVDAAYTEAAALLGRRTAEMHLALATPTSDPAFSSEPLTVADLAQDSERIGHQLQGSLQALAQRLDTLSPASVAQARTLLERRPQLELKARELAELDDPRGRRIRIHGDFHLGQTLRTHDDFVLLDFEGEPARSLAERRRKQSPLKDVAGMLRSFSYAAATGLNTALAARPQQKATLTRFADNWQTHVSETYLDSYRQAIARQADLLPSPSQADALLKAYLLEKALYELLYELNNRPHWTGIPLGGILALLN